MTNEKPTLGSLVCTLKKERRSSMQQARSLFWIGCFVLVVGFVGAGWLLACLPHGQTSQFPWTSRFGIVVFLSTAVLGLVLLYYSASLRRGVDDSMGAIIDLTRLDTALQLITSGDNVKIEVGRHLAGIKSQDKSDHVRGTARKTS